MRTIPEWIGATDDAKIPKRVKLRIWERDGGKCWISGRKILPGDKFDFDHKVALCNGGKHRESNLALALRDRHREKTRNDVAEKSKTYRMASRHLGLKPASRMQSRGFCKPPLKTRTPGPKEAQMRALRGRSMTANLPFLSTGETP